MSRLLLLLIPALFAASCDDQFRYKCQDPANWQKPECNPPACEADGTCTKYLLKDQNEN
jgi:hypothetical protein